MTDERWRRVNDLFEAAIALGPAERQAFVDEACGEDRSLRGELLSLLSADAGADGFLKEDPRRRILAPGTRLGDYEVLALLGSGGMGEVYRARDTRLDREVAVKVLPEEVAEDSGHLHRFEKEAKAAGALNHPHIVHVYQIGDARTAAGRVRYIAMELVAGNTLRERLRAGQRWRELLEPLAQVADALARVHEAGIVHRDLKPENVMISVEGWPKILDFGLAKRVDADVGSELQTATATRPGAVMGTPGYMSPEQIQGQPVDHRTDVFAFGCILYEAITGRAPFRRDSAVATLHAIVYEAPPAIAGLEAECPPLLVAAVERCLAKEREQRYDSLADVAAALRALAGANPRASLTTVAISTSPAARGSRLTAWAAAFLLVGGVVAFLAWRTASRRASEPGAPLSVEKLTSRGDVDSAVISPDGKYLAYSTRDEAGLATVWLRDLEQRTETRLAGPLPPGRFSFSGDGRQVLIVSSSQAYSERLYSVPIIGGEMRLIHSGANGYSVSANAAYVSFQRGEDPQGILFVASIGGKSETRIGPVSRTLGWAPGGSALFARQRGDVTELVLASPDGASERLLGALPQGQEAHSLSLSGAWSPSGEVLAVVAQARGVKEGEPRRRLVVVDPGGRARFLGDHAWAHVWAPLRWLPDPAGVLVEGDERLWFVSWPEGRTQRMPLGTPTFSSLSLSQEGTRLAGVQETQWSQVVVGDGGAHSRTVLVGTDVRQTLAWTPDGRLVVSATDAGSDDLYVMDADGGNRRRLTFTSDSDERNPSVCGDGSFVVFEAARGLWRVALDGTALKQITSPLPDFNRDSHAQCSPDGHHVIFTRWGNPALWITTIDGEAPQPLLAKGTDPDLEPLGFGATWSPGGERVAFFHLTFNRATAKWSTTELAIASREGRILARLPYDKRPGPSIRDDHRVQWSRDGRTLYYHLYAGNRMELWKRPLAGGAAEPVTRFAESLGDFEWSLDGTRLAHSEARSLRDAVLITGFR